MSENIYGEVHVGSPGERDRVPQLPNGDFFHLKKIDYDDNLIAIDYAIRSDINQLQSIEFDIVFSQQINRNGTNYFPVEITNRTVATTLKNDELEDFSLCLEYEVNDGLGHLIDIGGAGVAGGDAGRLKPTIQEKAYKEPSNNTVSILLFRCGLYHKDY